MGIFDKVIDIAKNVGEKAQEVGGAVVDKVQDIADDVKEKAPEVLADAKEKAEAFADKVEEKVEARKEAAAKEAESAEAEIVAVEDAAEAKVEEAVEEIKEEAAEVKEAVEEAVEAAEDKVEAKTESFFGNIKAQLDADGDGKVTLAEAAQGFAGAAGTLIGAVGSKVGEGINVAKEKAPDVVAGIKDGAEKFSGKVQELIDGKKAEAQVEVKKAEGEVAECCEAAEAAAEEAAEVAEAAAPAADPRDLNGDGRVDLKEAVTAAVEDAKAKAPGVIAAVKEGAEKFSGRNRDKTCFLIPFSVGLRNDII